MIPPPLALAKGYAIHGVIRRGEIFVTRKITRALAAILAGKQHISTWATWTHVATGAIRPGTSRPCG